MFEIYAAVNHFEQDDSAHAMILTGARDPNSNGPTKEAYSSGGYFNPDAYDGVSDKIMQQLEQTDIAQKRTTLKIYQCDKPVVAAINGPAIGGAYTLTLAAADQIYPRVSRRVSSAGSRYSKAPDRGCVFKYRSAL